MNISSFSPWRLCSRSAGLAGIVAVFVVCFGCGGSSESKNLLNGGNGTLTNGNSTGLVSGTTGGTGSGPPFTQTGTPLANVALPAGVWGGAENVDGELHPGSLQVSSRDGQLSLYCGRSAQYAGAIVLDANGGFLVQGTGHLRIHPLDPPNSGTVLFSGKVAVEAVNGKTETSMVLDVSDAVSHLGYGSYVFILGNAAPSYSGTCPGP